MKLTIEIPDAVIADLDTAIQKYNVRAAKESMETITETPEQFLLREVKGCLRNFILSEHLHDLQEQTEALMAAEADRLSKPLQP